MKKIFTWLIATVLSMLMAISVTAAPLDGYNDPTDIITTARTNEVKSLISAPETPVVVAVASKSQDITLINFVSTQAMKTATIHVSGLSSRLFESKCGAKPSYKPRNPR